MEASKKLLGNRTFIKAFFTLFAVVISVCAFAQDETKKIDVNINSNSGGFFASPWIWVVGIAVFVLLLVALLRGSGRRSA